MKDFIDSDELPFGGAGFTDQKSDGTAIVCGYNAATNSLEVRKYEIDGTSHVLAEAVYVPGYGYSVYRYDPEEYTIKAFFLAEQDSLFM